MRIVVKRIPIEIIELGIETYAQIDIEEILLTSYPPITKTVLKFYTEYTAFEFQKEYSVKIKNDDMVIKCYIGGLSNILIQKDAGERTAVEWYPVICDSEVHNENNPLTCYINPPYPAGSYNNGEKYCIVIAQSIPETTTINAPVMIQIGTGTTLYPLQNRCCAQVTACGVRTRTKYATRVATSATGGVFKMLGNPACSPSNNLTAINGTAPTTDTPVTQAVRKGAL